MRESEAVEIVEEVNAILKEKPLAKAVEDPRFQQLQQKLHESEWRTIVDEFQLVGGVPYGKARLVRNDTSDCAAIYGKNA